jgi:phosphoglycerol transferase MdoB-like AlkP superfamily enzyme
MSPSPKRAFGEGQKYCNFGICYLNPPGYMENANTELSGKTPAFISWLQVIGLVVFLISRLSYFRHLDWLLYVGTALIIIALVLRIYFDRKHGRKKAFRERLILLILALAILAGLIVFYLAKTNG